MRSRRSAAVTAAVVLASFVLGACGSPQRLTPTSRATPNREAAAKPTVFPAKSPSAEPTASASPSGAASPTASPSGNGGGGGGDNTVQATIDNKFTPEQLTVKAGTEVTWTAQGFHTVTGGKDGQADPSSPMKSDQGFQTYKVTFDKPGTYPYFCQPHVSTGMVGEIVVT